MLPIYSKRYVTTSIEAAAQVHGSARIWGTQCQTGDLSAAGRRILVGGTRLAAPGDRR